MKEPPKRRISLEEALVAVDPDDSSREGLRGNRCPQCDLTFFPKRQYCAKCCLPVPGEVLLPHRGKLETYSALHRKPPYARIEAPYVLGQVDTGAVRVISVIRGQPDELRVGMDVELVLENLGEDEEGNQLVTYAFKPTQEA